MDAALGAQPAIGTPALDFDRDTLQTRLLPLLLVDDLGREAVALGPAEIHPQQHLGPVGRLGAACACADRQDRRALVMLTGEQERRPLAAEVGLERGRIAVDLGHEIGIVGFGEQLDGGFEILCAGVEPVPCLDLGSKSVGLAKDLLGGPLVVPEARLEGQCVELGDAFLFGLEVKVAPRSTGSALRGRG
jgi:hypothetical protein